MSAGFSLTFMDVISYFHAQLAPRVRAMQDAIDRGEAGTAAREQMDRAARAPAHPSNAKAPPAQQAHSGATPSAGTRPAPTKNHQPDGPTD